MRDPLTVLRDSLGTDPMAPWRRRLRRLARPAWLAPFRTTPVSPCWGFDRGTPVDRHYIESFLSDHRSDIRGRVVELRGSDYTDRFGTAVTQREILDIDPANPRATIIADLAAADAVPAASFDCFVLTQTLQFIFDVRAAVTQVHRMLRPDGVVLATVPAVSRIAPRYGLEQDYWRFTAASCRVLFGSAFGPGAVTVRSYGNVRTATAFLSGIASEELPRSALDIEDDYFPVIIAIRATKP